MIRQAMIAMVLAVSVMAGAPAFAKSYANATLNGFNFSKQLLRDAQFVNTDANQASFLQSDLTGATFTNTQLNGADFRGALLRNVTFTNADLAGADFAGAVFEHVSFSNVDITGARLQRNQLSQVDMVNTTMDGVIWIDAAPVVQVAVAPRPVMRAPELAAALVQPGKKVDLTVNFEFDSDKILAAGHGQVDEIAAALRSPQLAGAHIRVEGHTDAKGSDDYNKDLSYRRAVSVKRALSENYGIHSAVLTVAGFGEAQPVASNETDEGRALNRRVTLVNIGNQ
ncbi:MAG: OmpA family protein [Pseudomonadota bacterium]